MTDSFHTSNDIRRNWSYYLNITKLIENPFDIYKHSICILVGYREWVTGSLFYLLKTKRRDNGKLNITIIFVSREYVGIITLHYQRHNM